MMSNCLTVTDFEELHFDRLDRASKAQAQRHLIECERCSDAFERFKRDESFLVKAASILGSTSDELTRTSDSITSLKDAHHLPRIEGYEVQRLIGRGGMAAVYEAVQIILNRTVALKLLPAVAGSAQPSLVTRFKREATAAAKLHHTNIIPIYDFGESRDGYYYAMELIHGPTLREMLRRLASSSAPNVSATQIAALVHSSGSEQDELLGASGDPSKDSSSGGGTSSTTTRGRDYFRQVAAWMADVAAALHFAHVSGVIHRDIKPANLILSTDGRIMVADFGLAKTTADESVTLSGSLLGTYRYMSPEQIGAKRLKVDARTDVYSLGATLYEMLTFQPAYPSMDREELFGQIMFREPVAPRKIIPAVPAELQTICLKAMEKSPDARYGSALAMAEDLQRYNKDLPIVAKPLGIVGRTKKLVRRHRAATTAVAVIVISSVLIAYFITQKEAAERRERTAQVKAQEEQLKTVNAMLNQGYTQYSSGNYLEAIKTFEDVLEIAPDSWQALSMLATAKKDVFYETAEESLINQALAHVTSALSVCPYDQQYYVLNVRSVLERARGDYAVSIATLNEARRLNSQYYPIHINLGTTFAQTGSLDEAASAFAEGLRIAESQNATERVAMGWRNLAAVQIQEQDPSAIATLAKAQQFYPKDNLVMLLSARAYLELDTKRDAEMALSFAITADTSAGPEHRDARIKRTLAWAQAAKGQWQKALDSATAALEFNDECPSAARLIRAWASAEMGELDTAKSDLSEAIRSWPTVFKSKDFIVSMDHNTRDLWFESKATMEQLRNKAKSAIAADNP